VTDAKGEVNVSGFRGEYEARFNDKAATFSLDGKTGVNRLVL
jgi:hypothetical protein